ncbi:MAG TPA: trypsin-like serine protease [Tepidisphaeraceae bacterium]|nr:trypsin-like serine protease [Tepidisphaeraceae bacterium]
MLKSFAKPAALLALLAVAPATHAVIITAGPGQGATTDWSGVGQIIPTSPAGPNDFFGTGALIAPTKVLTAAHVVDGLALNQVKFVFGGVEYVASAIAKHPSYTGTDEHDIAVVTLTQAVANADVYHFDDGTLVPAGTGQVGYKVGFGVGGDGTTGATAASAATYPYGTKRVARNTIDLITTADTPVVDGRGNAYTLAPNLLAYDFDNHLTAAAGPLGAAALGPDEGNTTVGDSGAPMLQWSTAVGAYVITGLSISGTDDFSRFGDIAFDTQVAAHSTWVAAQVPEPAALGALTIAGATLLARRRRTMR